MGIIGKRPWETRGGTLTTKRLKRREPNPKTNTFLGYLFLSNFGKPPKTLRKYCFDEFPKKYNEWLHPQPIIFIDYEISKSKIQSQENCTISLNLNERGDYFGLTDVQSFLTWNVSISNLEENEFLRFKKEVRFSLPI